MGTQKTGWLRAELCGDSGKGPHAGVSCFPPLRKTLQVKIVDDEEYEKKDNFFIELGQPQWLKRGISGER